MATDCDGPNVSMYVSMELKIQCRELEDYFMSVGQTNDGSVIPSKYLSLATIVESLVIMCFQQQ